MKRTFLLTLFVASLVAAANLLMAQEATKDEKSTKPSNPELGLPPGVTDAMLAPPPMPRFMLEKPAKPITLDEMIRQAREAAKRAEAQRKLVDEDSKTPLSKSTN